MNALQCQDFLLSLQQCKWPHSRLECVVEDSKTAEVFFKHSMEQVLYLWNDPSVIFW